MSSKTRGWTTATETIVIGPPRRPPGPPIPPGPPPPLPWAMAPPPGGPPSPPGFLESTLNPPATTMTARTRTAAMRKKWRLINRLGSVARNLRALYWQTSALLGRSLHVVQ
ncbi:MAG: hypothetical protein EPN98_22490 [Phenylobacterium sp.]|nr:MAG: hypothetical protein EPN98_22490 [Phenylobacterium sp.]